MKRRQDLWRALAAAADELRSAWSEDKTTSTPRTRTRIEKAIREFIEPLSPVIGSEAAFELHASFLAFADVNERCHRLSAAMAGRELDEADVAMMQRLRSQDTAALDAFEATFVATQTLLDAVALADGESAGGE